MFSPIGDMAAQQAKTALAPCSERAMFTASLPVEFDATPKLDGVVREKPDFRDDGAWQAATPKRDRRLAEASGRKFRHHFASCFIVHSFVDES